MATDFWFKFNFKDWANDVKPLSLAARGMLLELIIYLRQTEQPGVMPLDIRLIVRLTGCLSEEATECITEFKANRIFDFEKDENGNEFIISRRIIKEFEKSATNSENGKKGGNPNLKKDSRLSDSVKRTSKRTDNQTHNRTPNSIFNSKSDSESKGKGVQGKNQNNTDFMFELSKNEIWIEQTCMALKTDKTTIRMKLAEACALFDSRGEDHSQLRLFQSHFVNWLREDLKKPKPPKSKGQQQPDQLMDLILNQTKDATNNLNQ
jgi:hypothetical protein